MGNLQATRLSKMNKYLSIVLVILFFVSIVCVLLTYIGSLSETICNIILSLGRILGVIFLVKNGTFYKTRFWRFIYFCIALNALASLARLQRWTWANDVFNLTWGLFIVIYSLHFFRKKDKNYFDYLKWIWLILNFVGSGIVNEGLLHQDWLFIPDILLWILVFIQMKLLRQKQAIIA